MELDARAEFMIPDLTVVVPCFNEEDNVGPLADRILSACDKAAINVEIVLVAAVIAHGV